MFDVSLEAHASSHILSNSLQAELVSSACLKRIVSRFSGLEPLPQFWVTGSLVAWLLSCLVCVCVYVCFSNWGELRARKSQKSRNQKCWPRLNFFFRVQFSFWTTTTPLLLRAYITEVSNKSESQFGQIRALWRARAIQRLAPANSARSTWTWCLPS